MSQTSSDPAAPPPPAEPDKGQGGDGTGSVDARMSKIEATQERQGGQIEKILAAVTGGGAPAAGAPADPAQSLSAQVADEIRRADERRRAEEGEAAWRQSVTEVVEKVKAEGAPREPETGIRAVIRRGLFGKPELWAGWRRRTCAITPRGGCPG